MVYHVDISESEDANDRVLKIFIGTYETLSQLWNVSSSLYMNGSKRNEGLAKLLYIYKERKLNATIADGRKLAHSSQTAAGN